jgi:hypothetical protein
VAVACRRTVVLRVAEQGQFVDLTDAGACHSSG